MTHVGLQYSVRIAAFFIPLFLLFHATQTANADTLNTAILKPAVLSTLPDPGIEAKKQISQPATTEKGKEFTVKQVSSTRIKNLTWKAVDGALHPRQSFNGVRMYVWIQGEFDGPINSLSWQLTQIGKAVPVRLSEKNFWLEVPLIGPTTELELIATQDNESQTERLVIQVGDFELETQKFEKLLLRRHLIINSLGFSTISYSQSNLRELSEKTITLKGNYQYLLKPPHWSLSASYYFSLFPFSASPENASARFLGLNFRAGYKIPKLREPFGVTVFAGTYFVTMMVGPTAHLGFANLMGPQIYPEFSYTLGAFDRLTSYLKFSPVGEGILIRGLGNRELGIGVSWTHLTKRGHSIVGSLDYSNLNVIIDSVTVKLATFSVGVGYGFGL